ncbi:MAG: CHAT domain-containing protein [Crinalium sp.]
MRWISRLTIFFLMFLPLTDGAFLRNVFLCNFLGKQFATCNAEFSQNSRANAAIPNTSSNSNSTTLLAQSPPTYDPPAPEIPPSINPQPVDPGRFINPGLPNSGGNVPSLNQFVQQAERAAFELSFQQANTNRAVELFEEYQANQFNLHLGINTQTKIPTTAEISQSLAKIYQTTGEKPALSYIVSLQNEVHLILVLPSSPTAIKTNNTTISLKSHSTRGKNGTNHLAQQASNTERVVLQVSRPQIKEMAAQFIKDVKNQGIIKSNSGQKLYKELITPLEAKLKANNIDTLIVSADSGLRSIPIAALNDGQQFLIEKYKYALIPSFGLTANNSTGKIQNAQILAMGITQSIDNQPALPSAGTEISSLIKNIWQGKGLSLIDEKATLENLKSTSKSQNFGILHFATHAKFEPGQLSNSYIQIWNGKLQLNKLRNLSQELRWNQVSMLVLSACQTALGDDQAELGFAGMGVQAGIKTAIGTLWKVNDEGSMAFMAEFYSRLKTAPTKAEAFKQTQLAMSRGEVRVENGNLQLSNQQTMNLPPEMGVRGNISFSHPIYWSGFTLVGDWN